MKTKLPPLPKTGERRLLKLIAFLEKLPRRKFNFQEIVTEKKPEPPPCGTVCCALGWCPTVFPRLVKWEQDDDADCGISIGDWREKGEKLFGMREATVSYLFQPHMQRCAHPELPLCGDDATPKQVAKMLKKYLALTKEAA